MARVGNPFFQQHLVIAKARRCFALAGEQRVGKVGSAIDLAHSLAAAASNRLYEDRITDRVGLRLQALR